ncbi:glycosyltransferase family 4 protein [Hippea maritima]|uniref:Glycosyl transferase group 1 n=1 Tax=Hippea maritima (strain ATCC 700847 / DSM 10411 / MH2) TaxID=760142 RepID=F2LVR8_HIPMA|nr:glycosyltransferase family 4 protein [Hippea maritima]AEA33852.1 glycosyl transferase group 1 [Hippea maritima DSM 10411]
MKIVIFYKYFRTYGGQEKVIYNLVHYLADKGYKVDVYAFKVDAEPKNSNITVNKVYFPVGGGLRELFFALYSFIKGKKIKKKNKDVCILGVGKSFYSDIYRGDSGAHSYYFKRAVLKYPNKLSRLLYRLRKFLSLSHWVNLCIETLNFKIFADSKKAFILPSNFTKKQIIDKFKLDERKIVLISNGVDLDRFKPMPDFQQKLKKEMKIDKDELVFCFVSTNHKLKGLCYLLKALKNLKDKGYSFKLVVAGGNYRSYFKSIISRNNLQDRVICLGKRSDIETVYSGCDVFVYPTLYDAAALVVLEAMACGLVPVVSKYNGTSEVVINGENGFIINEPSDVHEIEETLEFVLENRNKLPKLRENVLNSIKRYPSSNVFSKIEEIIKRNCGA